MSKHILTEEQYAKVEHLLNQEEEKQSVLKKLDDFIGKSFFFRTVTYHVLGKVTGRIGHILLLEEASWIPDTDRFMDFIKNGSLNEVEPLGDWNVNLDSVTDFGRWIHELPKEQI